MTSRWFVPGGVYFLQKENVAIGGFCRISVYLDQFAGLKSYGIIAEIRRSSHSAVKEGVSVCSESYTSIEKQTEGPEVNMNCMSFIAYAAAMIIFMPFRFNAATDTKSVDEYNVPGEIEGCIKEIPGVSISAEINPFYLSGDLDGDGKLDFVVQVVRSGGKGLAVCLSSKEQPFLVGAGSSLLLSSTKKWRFDAWSIVPKESRSLTRPAKAKYDTVLLDIKETANGLLYWDGSKLCWEQLSD